MVHITLSIRKTLEEQAAAHFETAKKAKRKKEGTLATIERFARELPAAKAVIDAPLRKRQWYEAFRWTFTTDGFLVIGGRDSTTNELLIKKHANPGDLVFHTELPGSPFIILKASLPKVRAPSQFSGPQSSQSQSSQSSGSDSNSDTLSKPSDAALAEAAQFCAAYSRAWKSGIAMADIFWVQPEQLSKTANSGESLGKGSFVVRGEKHFIRPTVIIALGMLDGAPTAGAPALFHEHGAMYGVFAPGPDKASDLAKKLAKRFENSPDDWNALVPAGGGKLLGWKKGSAIFSTSAEPANEPADADGDAVIVTGAGSAEQETEKEAHKSIPIKSPEQEKEGMKKSIRDHTTKSAGNNTHHAHHGDTR